VANSPESVPDWDDDDDWARDPPPPGDDWQSYHVFFLAPNGKNSTSKTKPKATKNRRTRRPANRSRPHPRRGLERLLRGSLPRRADRHHHSFQPFAIRRRQLLDTRCGVLHILRRDRREYRPRSILPGGPRPKAFQKLEELRSRIAEVLLKHGIEVLDKSVLDLPVPKLKAGEDVFLEGPLRVRDAFFFRGP